MPTTRMQEFLLGLKSHDEEKRVRTAYDLQQYVFTELREISVDALITFLHEFNTHIYNMVTSSGANEKKGAIYAIICLMDIDEGQKTQSLSRSYNFLTNLITSCESGVSDLAVKALGRLLLVSGAPTVTGVEMLLDKHFSYIEHDETRRKLAILLVKELCLSVPSQFYQQIRRFFDIILEFGIWDCDANVREESVAAITVALTVGLQREAKEPNIPQWYPSCIHEILRGLEDVRAGEHLAAVPRNIGREERLHVTFLLLNALLKHANAAWEARASMLRHITHYHTAQPKKEGVTAMIRRLRGNSSSSIGLPTSHSLDQLVISAQQQHHQQHHPSECERPVESNIIRTMLDENYTKLCSLIAGFRSNRNALVQSSLLKLLPRLAAFRPSEFAKNGHLDAYLKHCLTIAKSRDKEKPAAFVCIGLLTIACRPATLPTVPRIMDAIRTSLPTKESMSRKRGPHSVEPSVLVCLSLVAHSLGPTPAMPELLALDQHPPPPSPAQIDDAATRANEAQDAVEVLLDPILASGLSPTLALCMQELALVLPGLKSHISDGLLSLLSSILIQRGGASPSSSGPSPSFDPQHTATIVLALRTLATFEFEETAGPWLLQVIRHISDHYVGHDNKEVRLEAVATVCHLLRPVCVGVGGGLLRHHHPSYNPLCNDHSAQHPLHAAIIYEHVSKVLWLSVTDMESDVRLCALASLETGFSVHLAQPENLQALVLALNDEVLEIRETAVTLLARLSVINPAYVHPLLRNLLLRVLGELDFTGIGRNRELSARTLRHLIARAPRFLRQYARPVMSVVVPILSQPDLNPVVTVSLMTAVGDLAQVSGSDILPWVPSVLPLLLSMLESGLCGWRRQVALVTLGQLVEATAGGVHHPYTQYPYLLQLLLSILKTETQQPVRRETLRVLGLLGAVDPYKHKMNVGAITIQRDTGVAVITIEDQDDNSQGPLVLSPAGPSEMLVNQSYGSMDEYYAACSVAAMLRMLREPSLAQYHDKVSVAINFTYKNLGAKGVPFLSLVVPSMLQVVRSCDQNYRGNFLTRLAAFIETVGQHIRNYVDDIVDVIKLFWVPDVSPELAPPLILVVKSVAVAMGVEFKVHLKDIMPLILKSLMADGKEKLITKSLLDMFSEFGVNLEEFLHVLVPHITKLFDGADVPLKVRSASITTMQSLTVDINMSDYVSRIVHPLLRTIDQWPELRRESLELLTTLIATLENTYACFIPVTNAILTRHKIVDYNYDLLVAKMVRGYAISDDERAAATFGRGAKKPNHSLYDVPKPNTPSNDGKGLGFNSKKAVWVELEKSLEFQRHTSKDEWMQWLLSIGMNLLKASPSVALKAVYPVSSGYPQVARDLFNVSFMAAWSEMNEALQDTFLSSLKNALKSQEIPEVTQALLNLTEFMEHSDKGPLPLEVSQLGDKAIQCRAYAKALHYKEEQFHKSPTAEVLQNLISINNKLGQEEAATGLLEYARKHNSSDMQLEERWFEKVHDWDQALELYNAKLEKTPENFDLALGKMRCMEALGEWDQLYETTLRWWDFNNDPESVGSLSDHYRGLMARLASSACWAAEEWSMMERAVAYTPPDTQTGAFYRAVLAVQQGAYDKAQQLINLARDLHDAELTAMSGESYERAYSSMVAVQTLAELEEVVQYSLVQERRPAIKNIWYQRLQSNQRVVDDWHKILLVRSLVLKPQEDMRPWLEFAAMCRKSSRFSLAKKTLVALLGCDPDTAPDQPLPIVCPNASYEYAKFLYTQEGQQLKAYNKLQTFVNHLNHAATTVHNEPSLRSLISKVYLKLGEWHENIYGMKEETLPVITTYNKHARATNELCYKAWHAYAYSNFQALLLHQTKLDLLQNRATATAKDSASRDGSRSSDGTSEDGEASDGDEAPTAAMATKAFPTNSEDINEVQKRVFGFACEAVKGFIRSITVGGSSNSVQDCLRLLTIWFQHGHHKPVELVLHDGLKTVHVDTWLQMIPQLIARIDTPRPNVSQLVHQVLTDFGRQHPQALLYPLTVAAKSSDRLRSNAAEQLLNKMREHSPVLVNQAATVSEELIRVAILRNERWHEALEEASRLYFSERNEQAMLRMLMPLHSMMDRDPETLNESAFNQTYGRDLSEAKDWCLRFQRSGNVRDLNQAWELYYNVFKRIARQLSSLTTLELHSVSPRLLACRDLDIAVPGSYAPNAPLICISYVHPSLQVLSTKQRPRKLCIRASTGHDIMFLLKGHEDLRQDERVMQLFGLVNTFLINNPETFRRNLTVQRYAVVPLSINSGLIGWLPHCDTLHVLIKDWREKKKHIQINIEHKLMLMMTQSLCHLTVMQKVEVFEHALEFTQGDDLAKLLWLKSPSSEVWFDRRTNYTRSLAAMSMIGYVLGLGDRHPSNLMLDQKSGKIIHIDFGDCFEVAMTREKYPEKIPFRLTRMLVNAMEVTGIDGTYRMTCESVMTLLRRNKDSVMAMLEAFIYDPLWRVMDQQPPATPYGSRRGDNNTVMGSTASGATAGDRGASNTANHNNMTGIPEILNKKAVAIVNRVRDKLTGRDFPNQDEPLDVPKQVDLLIAQATNHENLCQCYIGWCPFW